MKLCFFFLEMFMDWEADSYRLSTLCSCRFIRKILCNQSKRDTSDRHRKGKFCYRRIESIFTKMKRRLKRMPL